MIKSSRACQTKGFLHAAKSDIESGRAQSFHEFAGAGHTCHVLECSTGQCHALRRRRGNHGRLRSLPACANQFLGKTGHAAMLLDGRRAAGAGRDMVQTCIDAEEGKCGQGKGGEGVI